MVLINLALSNFKHKPIMDWPSHPSCQKKFTSCQTLPSKTAKLPSWEPRAAELALLSILHQTGHSPGWPSRLLSCGMFIANTQAIPEVLGPESKLHVHKHGADRQWSRDGVPSTLYSCFVSCTLVSWTRTMTIKRAMQSFNDLRPQTILNSLSLR